MPQRPDSTLVKSDFLNTDRSRAIAILLHGLQGEITVNGQLFNNTMPVLPLSDDDIANALTFVYNSFGNSGTEVTPDEVRAKRAETQGLGFTTAGAPAGAKGPSRPNPFE